MNFNLFDIFLGGVAFGAGNTIGTRAANTACDFGSEKLKGFKEKLEKKKAESKKEESKKEEAKQEETKSFLEKLFNL